MSKIRAKASMEVENNGKSSLVTIIVATVLAVVILAGATVGVLFATGVLPVKSEESSSSEKTSYIGEDNEVDIGDLLGGLES